MSATECRVEDCHRSAETTRFEPSDIRIEMCPRHTGRVQRLLRETRKQPGEAARLIRQGRRVGEVVTGP